MKKVVLGMIIATMAAGLIACGSDSEPSENTSNNSTEIVNQSGDNEQDTTNEVATENKANNGDKLTDEYLLSLSETPADEFRYEETDDGGIRIKGYKGDETPETIIVIPAQIDGKDVVEIRPEGFMRSYVKAIVTGKNVKNIGADAFSSTTIEKIIINGPVVKIEETTFQNANIGEIVFPKNLEEIGPGAFNGCDIVEIEIPSSVKNIKSGAFNLTDLESVYFTSGEIVTESLAFGSNDNLKKVYIPTDCNITFDKDTFYGSNNVTIVTPAGSAAEEFAKANGINVENE